MEREKRVTKVSSKITECETVFTPGLLMNCKFFQEVVLSVSSFVSPFSSHFLCYFFFLSCL